jgi:hypothetical protein
MTHSHTGWIVSLFNQISQVRHHTHEHNFYHHTTHKYSVFKTQCLQVSQHVRFTGLYFSVLNRLISAIRMNKWPTALLRLIRVSKCSSYQFICFQKLLKFTSPKSQLMNSFCDWWSRMSSRGSKFLQDINFLPTGSFLPSLTYVLFLRICRAAVFITLLY